MMGFASPWALVALITLAVPVALHWMRRRDLPIVEFPAVSLLKRAQANAHAKHRLVDLLLLLARLGLLASLCLGLAEPNWRIPIHFGNGQERSIVIVLDDSLSVTGRTPPVWPQALERARAILASLPRGSEAGLVWAGYPARLAAARSDELRLLPPLLDQTDTNAARGTDLVQAIRLAERELGSAPHALRQIVIISDFAEHTLSTDLQVASDIMLTREALVAPSQSQANAFIASARATPDPTQAAMLAISVEIQSQEMNGQRGTLRASRDDRLLFESPIEINNNGARIHRTIRALPSSPFVRLELDFEDALLADNTRWLLARPPSAIRVLIVDGDPQPVSERDEIRYLVRAIDLAPQTGGALSRRVVDPDTFESTSLEQTDVVILANVSAPSEVTASRLESFVRQGGGVWFTSGDQVDPRAYRARLGGLLPGRLLSARSADIQGPYPNPSAALLDGDTAGFTNTRTTRRHAWDELRANTEVPLHFSDGQPALLRFPVGQGQVAFLSTTVDEAWSNLPFQPGFLPLVVRTLRQLAPTTPLGDDIVATGTTLELRPPAGSDAIRVLGPNDQTWRFANAPTVPVVSFDQTNLSGPYRVEVLSRQSAPQQDDRLAFITAPPSEESLLNMPELVDDEPMPPGSPSLQGYRNEPMAVWAFLVAGLFAIFEGLLRLPQAPDIIRRLKWPPAGLRSRRKARRPVP